MHINRLDLNLFVVLDAIYTEGNITRAARTLNLTQPALSHALGRLRAIFNDPLFTRRGSLMMPTPLTRSLIGPVRQSLKTLATSVRQANAFDPATTTRVFTIGLRDVLETQILPPLLTQMETMAPGVDLVSARIDRRDMESELAAGVLDMAVDVLFQTSRNIHHAQLVRDHQVVVLRDGHPAAAGPLTLDSYLDQRHILVSSRRAGQGLEDLALARIDRHRRVALRCQQYFAACRVVSRTDLLLTMPEHYARWANQGLPNRIVPLPLDMPPLDIYLYWHENADADPAGLWMRALLRQAVEALAPM
ncbi:MAG: LysR family transcriptional regulator [Telmatospirillum sp.]|nr:LysR family transcriptional regulator [Telmatospirillum sp.]